MPGERPLGVPARQILIYMIPDPKAIPSFFCKMQKKFPHFLLLFPFAKQRKIQGVFLFRYAQRIHRLFHGQVGRFH